MDAWWERESFIKYRSPTYLFIVAPSSGGKTQLTRRILEHADCMFEIPPHIFISATRSGRTSIPKCRTQLKHTFLSRSSVYGGIEQLGRRRWT